MLIIKPKIQNIQAVRIKKGLSVKQLANKAKLNALTIINIENNLSVPNPSTASKICNALEVHFDEIFELSEKEV